MKPTAEDLRVGFDIVGKHPQPVCPTCQQTMRYAEGASEAHVPPHWYCPTHKVLSSNAPNIATTNEQELVNRIASMRASEREKAAKKAEGFVRDVDYNLADGFPDQQANSRAKAIAAAIRAGDKE